MTHASWVRTRSDARINPGASEIIRQPCASAAIWMAAARSRSGVPIGAKCGVGGTFIIVALNAAEDGVTPAADSNRTETIRQLNFLDIIGFLALRNYRFRIARLHTDSVVRARDLAGDLRRMLPTYSFQRL